MAEVTDYIKLDNGKIGNHGITFLSIQLHQTIQAMNTQQATFELKEDGSEIKIDKNHVDEVIPDSDFRFSLISLVNGEKYFVVGTENEVWEKLREAADKDQGLDLNVIL